MSILTYRVTHLPDLEKTEYHVQYGDDPASRLFKMQDNFLYTLHTIANQHPLTCSLVYAYNPQELDQDKKLQIFVRVNFDSSLAQEDLKQVHKIFANSFWRDFYKIEEVAESVFAELNWAKHISFGIKQEEKLLPTVKRDKSPSHYYLIQPFEPNPDHDFVGFAAKLEAYENPALIEVLIRPTNLLNDEQWGLENLLRALSSLTSYEVKTSEISGKVIEQPIDPVAERALRQFEDLREDIQSQRLYEVSIRVLAENRFNASLLLNEFWVESSQKPLYREIGIDQEDTRFSAAIESVKKGTLFSPAIWVEYWNKLPENSPLMKLARLHRLFTVEEVKACFRVVVPDPVVLFSGIPKETDLKSNESDKSILLGWQAGKPKNQAQAPLKSLNKHVFICGVPGSGKTTAVLNLLFQLWTEHSIPFLVIEPAKTEYRSMLQCNYDEAALSKDNEPTTHAYIKAYNVPDAIAKMQADLQIFSLGNERVCPFRFNPFAFYGKTTLDEHISTLEACFRAAMPLFGPLPALLAEAIEQVYALFGWQPQDRGEDGLNQGREFPNMQDLYDAITAILETKQYSSDVAGDIKTALEVRIGGLLRRSVGSMLNTRTSVPEIGSLMEGPVILEMDSLNEEQANLMTMFILATLRQYARITRKSGSLLKHVVVIEEAHNIVGTDAKGSAEEGTSNPKAEATKYIVRMLAEMRALGQGIIIADQLPSAVSSEVIKNTNVKLAHRTVSGDDREILQQSMLLTGTQSEELARANPGDAYLFMEGTYKSVRIKEPNTKLIYGIEEPPSNEELVEFIKDKGFYKQAIAAQRSLYQQKVNQQLVRVKDRLETLSQNCLNLISSGNQLLEISSLSERNLAKLALFSEQLGEFAQGLTEFLDSTSNEIDTIWKIARQQGIYDAIQSELIVQNAQAKIQANQQQLEKIKSKCLAKNNELKNQINEIASFFYQEAIIQLHDSYERYQKVIESKNNHWQVVAGVSSDTDVQAFEQFCTQSQKEILTQEELIHKKLISTNANQFANFSVREQYNQCQKRGTLLKNKINDIKHNLKFIQNQRIRLQEYFAIVQETFSDYSSKANKLIISIDQSISLTNIELAYKEIQDIRNQFDTALDEFDQLEEDNAIQLADKLNEAIEKMVNDINSIQENIDKVYQLKYLQFK
ncbi:MAG: hypothetical protein F6K41_06310 [Symploca sp. SIO3E6]|nr:hypothetical protein [Caldora sp. SIO3E6]